LYPDTKPFQEICEPMHQSMLQQHPDLQPIYDAIQKYNEQYASAES
jgi:hemoglobin-like flavoprotein